MTAKVESYLAHNRQRTKWISVDRGTRACVNCIWYEQYFRKSRGNIAIWSATATGYCLLHEQQRGALRQPCKDYETVSIHAPT